MGRPEITPVEFYAYEKVRLSGVTNMYMTRNVEMLSGLDQDTIRRIQTEDYTALREKYDVPAWVEEAAEELRADYATT